MHASITCTPCERSPDCAAAGNTREGSRIAAHALGRGAVFVSATQDRRGSREHGLVRGVIEIVGVVGHRHWVFRSLAVSARSTIRKDGAIDRQAGNAVLLRRVESRKIGRNEAQLSVVELALGPRGVGRRPFQKLSWLPRICRIGRACRVKCSRWFRCVRQQPTAGRDRRPRNVCPAWRTGCRVNERLRDAGRRRQVARAGVAVPNGAQRVGPFKEDA